MVWKLFDTMFLGGLQAFIFALLTVLYFGMAGGDHGDHDEHDEHDDAGRAEVGRTRTSALSHPGTGAHRGNQSAGQPAPNQGEKLTWQ